MRASMSAVAEAQLLQGSGDDEGMPHLSERLFSMNMIVLSAGA